MKKNYSGLDFYLRRQDSFCVFLKLPDLTERTTEFELSWEPMGEPSVSRIGAGFVGSSLRGPEMETLGE